MRHAQGYSLPWLMAVLSPAAAWRVLQSPCTAQRQAACCHLLKAPGLKGHHY